MELILMVVLLVAVSSRNGVLGQDATSVQKDFVVECIRPLGIRVTPSPEYRIVQTGCRGPDINVPLGDPYDVSPDCLVVTATGTAVQIILEESTSTSNLVGGFLSRVFVVSCDFPGSKGYKDTFNRDIEAIKQPEGLDPTATSGVFKFTGVLMSIIDKASFTARQWAAHLARSAFIGQELYLTISHPQSDEGQAFIIPRECRVRPTTGNFTTIWHHDSQQERCLEVSGITQTPVRVFSDVSSATDVMSLQFYGFQFLGHEQEVITFECDVLLCGDITSGSCGEEWTKLVIEKVCVTNKLPPLPRPIPTNPPGKEGRRRRRRQATIPVATNITNSNQSNKNNNLNSNTTNSKNSDFIAPKNRDDRVPRNHNIIRSAMPSSTPSSTNGIMSKVFSSDGGGRSMVQEETVRVEIRMLMPRAKITHMGSGSRAFPSAIVAILLAVIVRVLQDG